MMIRKLRRTFIRQRSEDDCGIACLSMIITYFGYKETADAIMNEVVPVGGCSIDDLMNLSSRIGLKARAVEMDMQILLGLRTPCILHVTLSTGRDHYIVYFGKSSKDIVIADPAVQVGLLSVSELESLWVSKAAIYYENHSAGTTIKTTPTWRTLFSLLPIPVPLMITMGLLTIITALSGVALTWYMQKAMSSDALLAPRIAYIAIAFLTMIGIFKAVTNHVRQRLLIWVTLMLNGKLSEMYLSRLFFPGRQSVSRLQAKMLLADINKMQNAVTAFLATIIADGIMVLLMIAVLIFILPSAAIITVLSILLIAYFCIFHIPRSTYMVASTARNSSDFQEMVVKSTDLTLELDEVLPDLITANGHVLSSASNFAVKASRFMWWVETLGTGMFTAVLALSFHFFLAGEIPFSSVITASVLTYIISNLIPRIISAVETVSTGADAAVQFDRYLHPD